MIRVRGALFGVAVAWLSCQAITLTLVPATLLLAVADGSLAECTCTPGADALCPMHHHQPADSKRCVMQGFTPTDGVMLHSLLGVVGFIPSPRWTLAPMPMGSPISFAPSAELSRFAPPDPPPPRA